MPWTIDDVEQHKKGLSEKGKRQWMRIANSVLARCMKNGGTEETCAASAIKQANGVVQTNKFEPPQSGDAPEAVKAILDAAYTSCRTKWVEAHPNDKENASNKTSCSQIAWGAVHNAGWAKNSEGKWEKKSKVKNNSESTDIKDYIINKNGTEADYDVEIKVHQGKPYLVVPMVMMVEGVHNGNKGPIFHSIDELGKFPESWNGIPVVINHPEVEGMSVSANSPDVIESYQVGKVYNTYVDGKKLKAEAWLDEDKLNEVSPDTLNMINDNQVLEVSVGVFSETEDTEGDWNGEHYVSTAIGHRPDHLAILTDGVGACSCADGCGIRTNKEKSIINKNIQSVDLSESGTETENTLLHRCDFSIINQKKELKMAEKCTPCIEKKVGELIANSQGRWTDNDKDFLQNLSEEQLDKMMPIVITKEKEVQVNVLSKEDQEALAAYKAEKKAKREQMIADIQTNSSKELWPDDVLTNMNEDTLKRVFNSVKKEIVADYSLNASINTNAFKSDVEPLYPMGFDVK